MLKYKLNNSKNLQIGMNDGKAFVVFVVCLNLQVESWSLHYHAHNQIENLQLQMNHKDVHYNDHLKFHYNHLKFHYS